MDADPSGIDFQRRIFPTNANQFFSDVVFFVILDFLCSAAVFYVSEKWRRKQVRADAGRQIKNNRRKTTFSFLLKKANKIHRPRAMFVMTVSTLIGVIGSFLAVRIAVFIGTGTGFVRRESNNSRRGAFLRPNIERTAFLILKRAASQRRWAKVTRFFAASPYGVNPNPLPGSSSTFAAARISRATVEQFFSNNL